MLNYIKSPRFELEFDSGHKPALRAEHSLYISKVSKTLISKYKHLSPLALWEYTESTQWLKVLQNFVMIIL